MRTLMVLAALAACSDESKTREPGEPPVVRGSVVSTASWDVDLFDPTFPSPTLDRFDTLGGTRQLEDMTIEVDHTAEIAVSVENASAYALTPDDYLFELYLQSLIQLGVEEDPTAEDGPPFFGPGAFVASLSVDLDPGEQYGQTTAHSIQFEAPYDWEETPTYLEAMIGEEPIQLVVGGFSEAWVYWSETIGDDALLYGKATGIQYSGTITVTYNFSAAE